jgi:hypothetical protein
MTSTVPRLPPELKDCRVLMVARKGHITEAEQMCRLRARGLDLRAVVEPDSPKPIVAGRAGCACFDDAPPVAYGPPCDPHPPPAHSGGGPDHSCTPWTTGRSATCCGPVIGLPAKVVGYRGAVGHVHRFDPWLLAEVVSPPAGPDCVRFRGRAPGSVAVRHSTGKVGEDLQGSRSRVVQGSGKARSRCSSGFQALRSSWVVPRTCAE